MSWKRIKRCPNYYVSEGGTVINQTGREVKQRNGKVFLCGTWLKVSDLVEARKVKSRLSTEMKDFVLSYKGSNSTGRLAFLATFGRSISWSSWYRLKSSQ